MNPQETNVVDDFTIAIGAVESGPTPSCTTDFASPIDAFDMFDVREFLKRTANCL